MCVTFQTLFADEDFVCHI